MNKQEIRSVLAELYRITGFRVSLHGANYEEIAAYPDTLLPFCKYVQAIASEREECARCDRTACERALNERSTQIYKCRFGLIEAVSPLYSFGTLTGFLMMGQVASCEEDAKRCDELLKRLCDSGQSEGLAAEIPVVDENMVRSYVKIMTICASYLTLSNSVIGTKPTVGELAKKYIGENIDKKLVIGDICEELKCSKSTLLTSFKRQYGITVNSYITELRLDTAVRLLCESDLNISEIARETGFSDQSYFSKVFSAKYGISPGRYRLNSLSGVIKS